MNKLKKTDKKRLFAELGHWTKMAEEQRKEIYKLRRQVKDFQEASVQLGKVVDAILVEVVKKFGTEVSVGIFEAIIPQPRIVCSDEFRLLTTKDEEKGVYIMRAERVQRNVD